MKRRPKNRKKKLLLLRKPILIALSIFIFSSYLLLTLLIDPFFKIEEVTFLENSKEEVEIFLKDKIEENGNNIFTFGPKRVEKEALFHFPLLSEVKMKRIFPSKVKIDLKEREKEALWCLEERCFAIDKEGVIFRKEELKAKDTIIFSKTKEDIDLGDQVIFKEELSKIFQIEELLLKELKIESFSFPSSKRIDVLLEEGWEIYFSTEEKIEKQMEMLEIVLEEEIGDRGEIEEYIDLRFGNVIYYK